MEAFASNLQNVFLDGKFSDLVVVCNDRTWNVHKLVLCAQSDFFSKACNNGFTARCTRCLTGNESNLTMQQEAKESEITLPEDDPEVVDTMLHYFYHFDYAEEKEDGMAPMLLNLKLLVLADKYFIEPLQKLATEKFIRRAYDEWGTDAFAEAVEMLFESGSVPSSLENPKLIVLDVVKDHADELFHYQAYQRFQRATVSAPAFLFEFVKSATAKPVAKPNVTQLSNMMWFKCPGMQCQKHAAVFAVRNSVPPKYKFNCPLKCTVEQNQTFWSYYKTEV